MENKLISTIYDKYGNTAFTNIICYSLSILDKNEYKIINIVNCIQSYLNKRFNLELNIENVYIICIYMYNSSKIIYDLPYMLDNIKKNGKPTLHIVYSETVVQLASISLMSESLSLLKNICDTHIQNGYNQHKIYTILLDNTDYKQPSIFTNNNKEDLLTMYDKMIDSLFKKCIKICIYCYSDYIDDIDDIYNIISNIISNIII